MSPYLVPFPHPHAIPNLPHTPLSKNVCVCPIPLVLFPHHAPIPHTPIPKPPPTPPPPTPLNPHPNAHYPIHQRPEIALWLHGVPIYGHTHPGACVGMPPTPLFLGSLPTFSHPQIAINAVFFAIFSHFLRYSHKIFANFRHLATAPQPPTRATPYKGDLPLFFSVLFFPLRSLLPTHGVAL